MKLVMTLLVRNEADILATNIEYHLRRGVDFFIATDNLSEDETREVLEHYRARHLLHLIVEPDDNYAQSTWVTRMARMAAVDFRADWVINSDADEFWWPEEANDLKVLLANVPPEIDALSVPRINFVPRASVHTTDNIIEKMTVRERLSRNGLGEPLPPKVCHRAYPDIEIAMGNHAVSRPTRCPVTVGEAALSIFHFPLRSFDQFAKKIALGGAALERNGELATSTGKVWRMLYKKWQQGDLEAYWREQAFTEAQFEAAIESRNFLKDERLKTFMSRPCVAD